MASQQAAYERAQDSDKYWRLPKFIPRDGDEILHSLKAHNYPVPLASDQVPGWTQEATHQENMSRIERSLPCYQHCKMDELRTFMQQRGLPEKRPVPRKERAYRIDILSTADDNPRFHGFMDLPPELRTSIYHYYCSDFTRDNQVLQFPCMPPLARIDRKIRKECLEVFFAECAFGLSMACLDHSEPHGRRLEMKNDSLLMSGIMSPAHLSCVQKLNIAFRTARRHQVILSMPRSEQAPTCDLIRLVRDQSWQEFQGIRPSSWRGPWNQNIDQQGQRVLRDELVRFARSVRARPEERNGLELNDLYRLRCVFERFFNDRRAQA